MTMTYLIPAETIRNSIEAIRTASNGTFLPGNGFDKADAPLLDTYLASLGYTVSDGVRNGPGQLHTVTTACGIVVSRNGYCHKA